VSGGLVTRAGKEALGTLSGREKAGIFWRSFFLQAVWNTRGMQNVGFCFALLPVMRRCATSTEARREFLKRQLGFFNTNPSLASYVLGAVAAKELEGGDDASMVALKKGLASPLGMSGDALLWGALRPLAGVVGILLALQGVAWAPLAVIAVYGVPHVALKLRGIGVGAAAGPAGAREVLGPRLRAAVRWVRILLSFGVGMALAMAATGRAGTVEPWRLLTVFLFLALAYAATRVRVPATLIALGGAAGGIVLLVVGMNGG
jgi:mannose/fructose/N-acetylgalactosamine-specific phosphotransferase system component IID